MHRLFMVGALAFDVVSGIGQQFGDDLVDGVKSFFSDGDTDVDMGISSTFIDSDLFAEEI